MLPPEIDPDTDQDEPDGTPVDDIEEDEDDQAVDEGDDQIVGDLGQELGAH